MTIENEHPDMGLDAEGPFLKRPLITSKPETGESWYLYQLRFLHNDTVYATTIYARNDSEAQDISDSLRETAMVDTRLAPIVRRAKPPEEEA